MSDAKKCDVCGAFYNLKCGDSGVRFNDKGNKYDTVVIRHHWNLSNRSFDLCDTCMAKVINVLKGDKNV